MRVRVGHGVIELVQGDITRETTDAIVDAANTALVPGGGVDGAITRAAGPIALAARQQLGGCATGDAKIGPGGDLPARYIIYAVGPVYRGGGGGEAALLASAYRRSLEVAAAHGLGSVAFPAISTGIYGYPMAEAADVALAVIAAHMGQHAQPSRVRIVLFDSDAYATWSTALRKLQQGWTWQPG